MRANALNSARLPSHTLQDPTGKITWHVTQNNKFEGVFQVGRKWQPYHTASRFIPLESTQNQDSFSLIGRPSSGCRF